MIRSPIEYEVREPTGLGLGTYDLLLIRQKIYTGDLHDRCEFFDGERWRPLPELPQFAEVFWLRSRAGSEDAPDGPKLVPRIAGWERSADAPAQDAPRAVGAPAAKERSGLLGRFFGKG